MKVSFSVIAVWIGVFLGDCVFDWMPLLSGYGSSAAGGAYYRIFTGVLLHQNVLHLAINCAAMLWSGRYLEKTMGSRDFACFSLVSVVSAQLLYSLLLPQINNVFGGSVLLFTYVGKVAGDCLRQRSLSAVTKNPYGRALLLYGVLGNIPVFPFMNLTTVLLHGTSFAVGLIVGMVQGKGSP